MAIKKVSGTTLPTFKFRSGGGIELISAAIKDKSSGKISHKLKVKEPGKDELREVAYYDTVIESSDIKEIRYKNIAGERLIEFVLRGTGEVVTLSQFINSNDIKTPDSTIDGEVVLFGSTDGKTLKNSGLTITEDYRDIDSDAKTLPTSSAVKDYLENTAVPLNVRLAGDNVSNVPLDKA